MKYEEGFSHKKGFLLICAPNGAKKGGLLSASASEPNCFYEKTLKYEGNYMKKSRIF